MKLAAERKLAEAKTVLVTKAEANKAVIGKQFKQMASKVGFFCPPLLSFVSRSIFSIECF